MSFNFQEYEIYLTLDILLHKVFRVTFTCIVIEMAAYEMGSSVRGYHVYKDLWDTSIGEDILMMKIDVLWL